MVWLNALAPLQPQAIQARERAQIRAIKGSIGHIKVFRMNGVGISPSSKDLAPCTTTTHPTPPTTPTS